MPTIDAMKNMVATEQPLLVGRDGAARSFAACEERYGTELHRRDARHEDNKTYLILGMKTETDT